MDFKSIVVHFEKESDAVIANKIPKSVIYLNDSGCKIGGFNIWGSTIQQEFCNGAFNRERGEDIKRALGFNSKQYRYPYYSWTFT